MNLKDQCILVQVAQEGSWRPRVLICCHQRLLPDLHQLLCLSSNSYQMNESASKTSLATFETTSEIELAPIQIYCWSFHCCHVEPILCYWWSYAFYCLQVCPVFHCNISLLLSFAWFWGTRASWNSVTCSSSDWPTELRQNFQKRPPPIVWSVHLCFEFF